MGRRVAVELIANPESMLKGFALTEEAAKKMGFDLNQLAQAAAKSATMQVSASAKRTARLQLEARAYKEAAAAAVHGSAEQAAALRKAAEAEKQLARASGQLVHEEHAVAHGARQAEHDIGRLARGAIYGSGVFRSMGRSIFYAGGSLIGAYGITQAIHKFISAATDSQAIMTQVTAATRAAGLSWRDQKAGIDEAITSIEKLGFTEEDAARSFTLLIRGSRDVRTAHREEALAADIARGRNIALSTASNAVARAYGGQTAALRRLVPFIQKGASAQEAIRQASQAYANSAEKFAHTTAGAYARLQVAIHRTEVGIGTQLLPTITRLLNKSADWLQNSENQKRIQRDVHDVISLVTSAVKDFKGALDAVLPVLKEINKALGGTKETLKILGLTFAAIRFGRMLDGLMSIRTRSRVAAGEVSVLRARLIALRNLG